MISQYPSSLLVWYLFLKNLDISITFLEVFTEIEEDNFMKLVGLSVDLSLLKEVLDSCNLGVSLDVTLCLKVLFSLSVISEFQLNS